jgi:hypothetical protein
VGLNPTEFKGFLLFLESRFWKELPTQPKEVCVLMVALNAMELDRMKV